MKDLHLYLLTTTLLILSICATCIYLGAHAPKTSKTYYIILTK